MTPSRGAGTAGGRLQRDLRLFQLYRFLSTSYLFAPVVVVFFVGRGLSVTEITLLNTVYCATVMLFEVPTGILADRFGRRRAMILGSLLMAAGCVVDWGGHSFIAFVIGEGLLALGMTLSSGADSAYLYDLLVDSGRPGDYRRMEGAASASKLVGAAVALALGGWVGHFDTGATYLVTALVCVAASGVAALLCEHPRHASAARARSVGRQIVAAVHEAATHRPLAGAILFSALVFALVRMGIYMHQPYLAATGLGLSRVGLIMAVLSLLAAWGAHRIDWLRDAFGERTLVWGLPALLAGSYFALGLWSSTGGIAMIAVQYVASGLYSPLSKDLLNREIADSTRRATLLSVESMGRRLVFGLFSPLCGLMVDRTGLAGGLFACAAFALLGAVALGVAGARRRSPRSAPVATPDAATVAQRGIACSPP